MSQGQSSLMDLIPVTSLHNMNVDTMENSDLAFCTYHEDGTSIQQTAYSHMHQAYENSSRLPAMSLPSLTLGE